MELNKLPIIDWPLSLKLAGNKKEIVDELLGLLIKTLPKEIASIKQACKSKNYEALSRRVHKLHGALCYCGLPRIKNIIVELELALKKKSEQDITLLVEQLESEANLVLEQNFSEKPNGSLTSS